MTTALEAAWDAVLTNISGPASINALVAVLDRIDALDEIKQRVLAEAAAELQVDRTATANVRAALWLQRQLAYEERRARDLQAGAKHDRIGWRSVERAKRGAGAIATQHDRASWWSLAPPSPPAKAAAAGTLDVDR